LVELGDETPNGQVIDFTAHRLGLVRRALSHDVIRADDDFDDDDDFEFALFAVNGRRGR
jgi:hypothetical protein